MNDNEKDFLLAEFNNSWEQLFNIDNRRGIFYRYYTILFIAVLGVVGKLLVDSGNITLKLCICSTIVFGFTYIAANTTVRILQSERAANIRYRKKINLIRELFLKDIDDEKIQFYLRQKDIGILLYTDDEQPSGSGRTLKGIYNLIKLQKAALIFITITMWLFYTITSIIPLLITLFSCK